MCRMKKRRNNRWRRKPTALVSACTEESTLNGQQVSVMSVTVRYLELTNVKICYIGNDLCSSVVS